MHSYAHSKAGQGAEGFVTRPNGSHPQKYLRGTTGLLGGRQGWMQMHSRRSSKLERRRLSLVSLKNRTENVVQLLLSFMMQPKNWRQTPPPPVWHYFPRLRGSTDESFKYHSVAKWITSVPSRLWYKCHLVLGCTRMAALGGTFWDHFNGGGGM